MQMVACVPYLQSDAAAAALLQAHDSEDPNSADKYIYLYMDVKSRKKISLTLCRKCVFYFFPQVGGVMFKAGGRPSGGGTVLVVSSFSKTGRCLKGQRLFIFKELQGWNSFFFFFCCEHLSCLFQTEPLLCRSAVCCQRNKSRYIL